MSERTLELMSQAQQLNDGPEQVALLEEAVREADMSNDIRLGFEARMELVKAGIFGGFAERAIVAFSWCLARFDESPEEYNAFDILWRFKWIVNNLHDFPTIPREKIAELEDELERRFTASGYSSRPVHVIRAGNAMTMGDKAAGLKHFEKWQLTERDGMADCAACEQNHSVVMLSHLHRNEEALSTAEPILAGRMRCAAVPQGTYGDVVRPLLRLGRLEEALDAYRKGYRLVSANPKYMEAIAEHMLTLLAADDVQKAVRLFEKHLPWAVATANPDSRFRFYNVATLFLEKLDQHSKRKRKLTLPSQLPCYDPQSKYDPAELAAWFAHETQQLADQFNRRNGNEYYNAFIAECRKLVGLAGW